MSAGFRLFFLGLLGSFFDCAGWVSFLVFWSELFKPMFNVEVEWIRQHIFVLFHFQVWNVWMFWTKLFRCYSYFFVFLRTIGIWILRVSKIDPAFDLSQYLVANDEDSVEDGEIFDESVASDMNSGWDLQKELLELASASAAWVFFIFVFFLFLSKYFWISFMEYIFGEFVEFLDLYCYVRFCHHWFIENLKMLCYPGYEILKLVEIFFSILIVLFVLFLWHQFFFSAIWFVSTRRLFACIVPVFPISHEVFWEQCHFDGCVRRCQSLMKNEEFEAMIQVRFSFWWIFFVCLSFGSLFFDYGFFLFVFLNLFLLSLILLVFLVICWICQTRKALLGL